MSTVKQKEALNNMVENGGNASRAMVDAGYSPNTAKTPSKLTKSMGFQDLCDQSGLTKELLIKSLVEDIKSKVGNRKAEIELGLKIRGCLGGIDFQEKEVILVSNERRMEIDKALSQIYNK